MEPLKIPKGNSIHNFIVSFILAIIIFPFIGFLAESSSVILKTAGVGFANILLISTIAGLLLVTIMVFLVYYVSTISYNKNLDPDNIVIPISTSITDSISSLTLIGVSLFVLGMFI